MKGIQEWLDYYNELRRNGRYLLADELREMLRRMGYKITVRTDEIEAKQVDTFK